MLNKRGNNKNIVIALLVIIIVILGILCILFATNTISLNSKESESDNDILNNDDVILENNIISQEELEKIVTDELYIITNRDTERDSIKSINDIKSYDLETLVINIFNSSSSSLTTISKDEMQDILNDTCLSNLSITFDGTYTKNEYTKRNLLYGNIVAYKTIDFFENDNQYVLSVKFLFTDNGDSGDRGQYGYGSIDDLKNEENYVTQIYDNNSNVLVEDIQNYLDENYETIKDKLDTYIFTFEKQDGKITLVNFSVN